MKASLKFRDDQKPLFKAKLPLNILNFPFRSGVVAGHSKELSLQLGTFFESGPSLKLAYNPNDGSSPFNLVVKTGTGKYGSPIKSSMVMSAEFNLVGNGGNPSFMVYFKPKFGDFGIRKKQSSSVFVDVKDCDDSIEVIEKPKMSQGYLSESFEFPGIKKMKPLPSFSCVAERLVNDVEMNAATSLPVLNFANVNFQWGLRFPTEMKNLLSNNEGLVMNGPPAMSFRNIPCLVMNKISIEHIRVQNTKNVIQRDSLMTPDTADKDDVSKMCLAVRHQLDTLRDENGMLRKAVDDLRSKFSSVSLSRPDEAEVCKPRSNEKDNRVPTMSL